MAQIKKIKNQNGSYAYKISFRIDGRNKSINLNSSYTKKRADEIRRMIEGCVICHETDDKPSNSLMAQLVEMSETLKKKFETAGLIDQSKEITAWALWNKYYSYREKDGAKENSLSNIDRTIKHFFEYFKKDLSAGSITAEEGISWRKQMKDAGYSEATLAGHIKNARAAFNWAVSNEYLSKNVFSQVTKGSFVNKSREHEITREDYQKLLDACPDQNWRTFLALCRIGGLRNPSETMLVKWQDINWDKGRLLVHSTKTERHERHSERWIPLFPELRKELAEQFTRPGDNKYVIPRYLFHNIRKNFEQIIFNAGLIPWQRLFHNLRGSRSNELNREYAAHLAGEWMGQSMKVAQDHYLHASDEDFVRACQDTQDGKDRKERGYKEAVQDREESSLFQLKSNEIGLR